MSKTIFDSAYDICRSMRATCEAHPALASSVAGALAAYHDTDESLPDAERWDRAGNAVSRPPGPALTGGTAYINDPTACAPSPQWGTLVTKP